MGSPENPGASEKADFSTETITGKNLLSQIYHNGQPDPRFLPIEDGGVFYYSPLHKFSEIKDDGIFYSLLRVGNHIVGIAQVQQSPYESDVLWFKSIAIDNDLKGQKYSDPLLHEVFRFAKSKNSKLQLSKFTTEGKERIEHKIKGLAHQFDVLILDRDGNPLY